MLKQLKAAAGDDGALSVRVTLFYTTRKFKPLVDHLGTLGYMVGSIGEHNTYPTTKQTDETIYDTLNVPGQRAMFRKDPPFLGGFEFPADHICSSYNRSYKEYCKNKEDCGVGCT